MKFTIIPGDSFIWNRHELIDFLIQHQGQSITISTNQEGCCCKSIGLYQLLDAFKYTDVTIETPNELEHHPVYQIQRFDRFQWLKVSNSVEPEYHTWNGSKIFGTVYGRPLWHRLGITTHLVTNHSKLSSIGCLSDPANEDLRDLFEIKELFKYDFNNFKNFSTIVDKLPLVHNEIEAYTPGQCKTDGFVKQTKPIYKHFLIDVVAETFTSGHCFWITEKTARPMLLKKPFIVMAAKDHLLYLRQMGFKTFNNFWDEDYDGFDGQLRYHKILQLIDSLAQKSHKELDIMYKEMTEILDHNYNILLTQTYSKQITEIT